MTDLAIKLDNRPLYIRAEEALAHLLASDLYNPGDQLPPEPDLAQMLGISRATLRETLRSFEERGLIHRQRGVGTFVRATRPLIESGLETLESLDSLARRMGLTCESHDLDIEQHPANVEQAAKLGIAPGEPVIAVSRTKTTNGLPVAYMIDLIPTAVASLEQVQAGFTGSVLDFLLSQDGLNLAYAWTDIVATQAGQALAARLDMAPTDTLLLLEETIYSVENETVNYSQNYFGAQYFHFHVIRRILPGR
ncbi:MAG: GntR family transcriptional regulator [Chloroflexota bacterium]